MSESHFRTVEIADCNSDTKREILEIWGEAVLDNHNTIFFNGQNEVEKLIQRADQISSLEYDEDGVGLIVNLTEQRIVKLDTVEKIRGFVRTLR